MSKYIITSLVVGHMFSLVLVLYQSLFTNTLVDHTQKYTS